MILMTYNLESNTWSSSDANGQTYKNNSTQTLVHKVAINYQNHTWGHHALSDVVLVFHLDHSGGNPRSSGIGR